jgi:hypothetical protein
MMVWQGCEGSPQKRKCGPLGTPALFPWGSWRSLLIQINTMIFGECWNPHSCRSRKYYSHVCHGRGPVCKCRGLTSTHWLVIEVQGWACNVDGLKVVRNLLREGVQASWIPEFFFLGQLLMQFVDTYYSFQTMQYRGMFGSICLPIEDVTAAQV